MGNLPEDVTEQELRMLFQAYGTIEKIHFTKAKQRFSFIYFQNREAVATVLSKTQPFVCFFTNMLFCIFLNILYCVLDSSKYGINNKSSLSQLYSTHSQTSFGLYKDRTYGLFLVYITFLVFTFSLPAYY